MLATLEVIQTFMAPVVMVSANGLMCLAFYNRLSSVVNRTRTINKERVDLRTHLTGLKCEEHEYPQALPMRQRSVVLEELSNKLFQRASWMRRALYCLLGSILCMLGCSLALGLSTWFSGFANVGLGLFVSGTLVMMLGAVMAIQELRLALDPLAFESHRIDHLLIDEQGLQLGTEQTEIFAVASVRRNCG